MPVVKISDNKTLPSVIKVTIGKEANIYKIKNTRIVF